MIYFLALIPATALTVAGYFVLFLAKRSEGGLREFGKYLGFWAFTLAGLVVLGAIFAAAHSARDGGMIGGRGMHGRMERPWHGDPRFWGPRAEEESRNADRPGDAERPHPQPPSSGASPAEPQAPPPPR